MRALLPKAKSRAPSWNDGWQWSGLPLLLHDYGIRPLGRLPLDLGFLAAFLAQAASGHCGLWIVSTSPLLTLPSHLAELRLEGNFLHRLPNEVSTLQHLKAIDLSRNQFHDFPEQLTTLPALENINLEENEIVGKWTQPMALPLLCLQSLP